MDVQDLETCEAARRCLRTSLSKQRHVGIEGVMGMPFTSMVPTVHWDPDRIGRVVGRSASS